MTKKINNLYIHIPFCDHICSYCDFYKMISKKETIDKYINYLEKEFELKKELLNDVNIIYIGGGTPSSIGIDNLTKLFEIIKKYIKNDIIEFSIECNPKDVTLELINLFKKYGVNRISLGIQSLYNKKLALMRRNHNKKDVIKTLKLLKDNNFNNVNADLIYAFPHDTMFKVKKDLRIISKYVTHFSCYSLILEEKTILYQKYKNNEFKLFNPDSEANLYYGIIKYLDKLGYKQYEISNFSLPGYECLYNLNTWNNEHYIGIGASASYYIDNIRYTNVKNLDKYFEMIDNKHFEFYEKETINKEMQMFEEIMLGLRKVKGIDINNFNLKYDCDIFKTYPNIDFLIKNNFLKVNDNHLFIPQNELYVSNSIINKIVE